MQHSDISAMCCDNWERLVVSDSGDVRDRPLGQYFISESQMEPHCKQGRRHGFESGGNKFCERSQQKIFVPHFLASGGQNIA